MDNKALDVNRFYNMYSDFIARICKKYNYNENIKHLVTLMMSLFLINYDSRFEKIIISCFEYIEIMINNCKENNIEAFYYRKLYKDNNYKTKKYIVINGILKDNYVDLIDSIVHEFNHAVNSFRNEIIADERTIHVRAGVCSIVYDCNNLNKALLKSDEFVLEEVINTRQTEKIINSILEIDAKLIDNQGLKSIIETIQRELEKSKFKSKAYLLEVTILEKLISNKTFINTIEELRITGEVDQIEIWFDSITMDKGSYNRLNKTLRDIIIYEEKIQNPKWNNLLLKNKIIRRIAKIEKIVERFNKNCNYI